MSKTGIVDWAEIDPPQSSSGGGENSGGVKYLRLEPGKSYIVRPVHKPMAVYKYFNNLNGKFRFAVVGDPENCPVRRDHQDLEPTLKYAINVIDRADGEIKVLEAPPSVFRGFRKWHEKTSKNPGSETGGDFGIDVEIPKGATKRQTRYDCQFVEPTPFSADEMKLIKGEVDGKHGLYNLPEIYKPMDSEKIEKMLFDENFGSKEDDSGSSGGGGDDKDLFDDGGKDSGSEKPVSKSEMPW